jgi:molybdenum cofactor cytidylyltransferase
MSGRRPGGQPAAALILAAGRSTRFGADKLAASYRGRPLLQWVVDAAVQAGLSPIVVVVGPGGSRRRGLEWGAARRVVNRDREGGLSSSLKIGLKKLAADGSVDRAVVLLADQPLVSPDVIARLLVEPGDDGQSIIVPVYAGGHPGNPVVLDRTAWPLAETLAGDRGMAQLFAARPELVRYVGVAGENPDVDTPEELAGIEQG